MSKLEDIYTLERLLKEYNLPVSTILDYEIKQKIEEFSSYNESTDDMLPNEVKEKDDSSEVKPLSEKFEELTNPLKETESEIITDSTVRTKTDLPSEKKSKNRGGKIIRVTRPDRTVIQYHKAAATISQTIKEIGAEKVATVHISVDGMNLVNLGGNPLYPSAQYDVGNGFFVNTHSNTEAKARYLRQIFKTLNLDWKVEILEDSTEDDGPKE